MEEEMKKLHVVMTDLRQRLGQTLFAAALIAMLFAMGGFTTTAHAAAGDLDANLSPIASWTAVTTGAAA